MGSVYLNPSATPTVKNLLHFRATTSSRKFKSVSCWLNNSQSTKTTEIQQQQLNLSVLRFTFGIPGFDESYLPRWIGYGLGSLLILNHFVGSNSSSLTSAQLRTEGLGLSLAAFSITLPYLGRFLKGASQIDQATVPESAEQIFVMSPNMSDREKEELAWATYVLLRNTNTISVLISVGGKLCVRGYWNTPNDMSKVQIIDWFQLQVEKLGLADLTDARYFPERPDFGFSKMLLNGTRSILVQPAPCPSNGDMEKVEGFLLLASTMEYAYDDKNRAWIKAIANKL